jgi:hypothetical protein
MILALAGCTRPNPAFRIHPADAEALAPDGSGPDAEPPPDGPVDAGAPPTSPDAAALALDGPPDRAAAPDLAAPLDQTAPPRDGPPADAIPDPRPVAGMVAFWPFDQQPAGTVITDRFNNSATLHGTITWVTDVPPIASGAHSIHFDGTSAYLDLAIAANLRPTSEGPKTLALWFKSTSPGAPEHTMIAVFNSAQRLDVGVQVGFNVAKLAAWRYGRTSDEVLGATAPAGWHHAAYTYAAGVHLLYLDGAQTAMTTGLAPVAGTLDAAKLGTYDQNEEPMKYQGMMSDVRVYNRALTPAEVRSLAGL